MLEVSASGYELRYLAEEDRIAVVVRLGEQELVMPITRRMTRQLIDMLGQIVAQPERLPGAVAPELRETVLDFQHSASVAHARSEGALRDVPPAPAPTAPVAVVREIVLLARPAGAVALALNNAEQRLTIEIEAVRLHPAIEAFVQIAQRAGWDLAPSAPWLDSGVRQEGGDHPLN